MERVSAERAAIVNPGRGEQEASIAAHARVAEEQVLKKQAEADFKASVERARVRAAESMERAERNMHLRLEKIAGASSQGIAERVVERAKIRDGERKKCNICSEWIIEGVCKCTRDGTSTSESDSEASQEEKNQEARVNSGPPPGLGQEGDQVPYDPFHPLSIIMNHHTWADLFARGAKPEALHKELTRMYVDDPKMQGHSVLMSNNEKAVKLCMKLVDTAIRKQRVVDDSVGDLLIDLQVNLVWARDGREAADAYRQSMENNHLPEIQKRAEKAAAKAKAEAGKGKVKANDHTAPKVAGGAQATNPPFAYPKGWATMSKGQRKVEMQP